MKLTSPKLKIDEVATEHLIESSLSKVQIMGIADKLGFTIGSFIGRLVKGFREGRKKT